MLRLVILFASVAALGQVPSAGARVEGRVVNAATGEGLRKVWITLRGDKASAAYSAQTDAQGAFQVDGIAPGQYMATGELAGFLFARFGSIQAKTGQTAKFDKLSLTPQAIISGRVLDEDGDPLPSVTIQAWKWGWSQTGQRQLTASAQTTADETGAFRIPSLAAGRYFLSASGSRTTGPFDDRAVHGGLAYVTTYYPGVFRASEAAAVDVRAGGEARGTDLRLRRAPIAAIRGLVRHADSGVPFDQVALQLTPLDAAAARTINADNVAVSKAGVFEFPRVLPGAYSLSVQDPTSGWLARLDLEVGAAGIDGLVFDVGKGGAVDVVVEHATSKIGIALRPTVDGVLRGSLPAQQLGTDGAPLHFTALMPGDYWPDLLQAASSYIKAIYVSDNDATLRPIKVSTGMTPVRLVLADDGGTVTGVVRNGEGKPAGQVRVVLFPADKERQAIPRFVKTATTSGEGQLKITAVPPGDYRLLAFEEVEQGALFDPAFRALFDDHAAKVAVDPNGTSSIDRSPISAGSVADAIGKLR